MLFQKTHDMPTADAALPGRDQPVRTDEVHYVTGRPLKGPHPEGFETAVFGMGCFWGVERVFWQLPGVWVTSAGYAGGFTPNPTYEEVCSGRTGHAEVVQVEFDPAVIPYREILRIFFAIHDPTTLDRQGNDVGEQYRSAIFHHDDAQRRVAEEVIAELSAERVFGAPIVTQVAPMTGFWKAEESHQQYYERNPDQPYCQFVVAPKVAKLRQSFANRLRQG